MRARMSGSVRGAVEKSIAPTRRVPGMGTGLEVQVLYGASW